MTTLLELKQAAKIFYMKYEVYITHVWKFLLALICLLLINGQLGYLAALNSFPIVLMAALLCSILPTNFTVIMAAVFVLGHLYELSRECMLIGLVLFLLMFLLYYRFSPAYSLCCAVGFGITGNSGLYYFHDFWYSDILFSGVCRSECNSPWNSGKHTGDSK